MRKNLKKDQNTRNNFLASEKNRLYNKLVFSNSKLNSKSKWLVSLYSTNRQYSGSFSSKVRIKNFCLLTGRSRSIYRKFRMSRILLRQKGAFGELPGISKDSW
jgi:ribosomal protein S14